MGIVVRQFDAPSSLIDGNARQVSYIRVSVTDRCNYRCKYCMPAEGVEFMERDELLRFEETARIVGCFARLGVERVRLTGGEPLLRRDLHVLVRQLRAIPGIRDIALTTNGHLLERLADEIVEAGLSRFNVSLDSLDPDRFRDVTRGGDLGRVLRGIDRVLALGVRPLKINMVVMPDLNTDEITSMVGYFADRGAPVVVRFIEYMPFRQRDFAVFSADQIEATLRTRYTLEPAAPVEGGGPAQYLHVAGTQVDVGFIAPITRRFCASCNRVRLSSDGQLRTCLAYESAPSLRDLLRQGITDEALLDVIRARVLAKPEGHGCAVTEATPKAFEGFMSAVGG